MEKKIKAFNAVTQQVEDAVVTVDKNNEFLVTFADSSFLKFPADFDVEDLKAGLKANEEANLGQVSAAEMEAQRVANEEKLADL
jgi:hypothetical protein